MLSAGLGYSTRLRAEDAAAEATDRALAGLAGRPVSAVLAMVTAAWGTAELDALVAGLVRRLDCHALVGATVDGLQAGTVEVVHAPAVAVWALSGVDAEAVLSEPFSGGEEEMADALGAQLGIEPRPEDLLIVLPDSLALSPQALLAGLEQVLPGLALVGLGACEPAGDEPRVWAGDEIARGGCAGLLVRPSSRPGIAVTSGCRPRGGEWQVTRSAGRWVRELAGRPAIEVLHEIASSAGAGGTARDLQVVLSSSASDAPPLLRNVVGTDTATGSFALPEPVLSGDRIRFAAADPEFARADLLERAASLGGTAPVCALHLSCRTRGAALFGEIGTEGALLDEALGGVPVLGLMGAYQLVAASGSVAQVHTYAGVLTVFGD